MTEVICDTPESIRFFQLCSLRGRLRLEMRGMKCHGPSALSHLRRMGFHGSRQKVLEQLHATIEEKLGKEFNP